MSHKSKADTAAPRTIKVFIASPGDLAVERSAFKEVVDELNHGFGDGAGVKFEALGWEDTLASTGRRSQGVINQEVDRCDVFVLTMHRRWGQDAPDAAPYSSYTEEEFYRAYSRWKTKPKTSKKQAPEIFVFFKHIDPGQMNAPDLQLQKVLEFRKQLEDSREVLYRGFADEAEFCDEINRHLRAFAKGELPKADAAREKVLLPPGAVEEIKRERAKTAKALKSAKKEHKAVEAAVARAEGLALGLAESAAKAALDGRVEQARQDFAKATDGTKNLRILYLASEFYWRTGDLKTAEEMLTRWLAIGHPDAETTITSAAIGNLALIYKMHGDLDKAEEMHNKALAIDEKLKSLEGMARGYGNLGLIWQTRGDAEKAEEMHNKSLVLHKKLRDQNGMASNYGNLGLLYRSLGDLRKAEKMLTKALAINKKLRDQAGTAAQYGNLGYLYQSRGELDKAKQMLNRALAIDEKLGYQEGIANQYGNLGGVYYAGGELAKAEEMHKKSLAINENLRRLENIAIDYANLGLVAEQRGDMNGACESWTQSLDLLKRSECRTWLTGCRLCSMDYLMPRNNHGTSRSLLH